MFVGLRNVNVDSIGWFNYIKVTISLLKCNDVRFDEITRSTENEIRIKLFAVTIYTKKTSNMPVKFDI